MAFGSIAAVTDSAGVVQVLKSFGAREALTVLLGRMFFSSPNQGYVGGVKSKETNP